MCVCVWFKENEREGEEAGVYMFVCECVHMFACLYLCACTLVTLCRFFPTQSRGSRSHVFGETYSTSSEGCGGMNAFEMVASLPLHPSLSSSLFLFISFSVCVFSGLLLV